MPDDPYSLADLARFAGVTPRTVRYYVAQGLLPSPDPAGPATRYGEGHLSRLRLIKRLQRDHLPLAEIRARLERMGDDEVEAALDTAGLVTPEPPMSTDATLAYVRRLMTQAGVAPRFYGRPAAAAASPPGDGVPPADAARPAGFVPPASVVPPPASDAPQPAAGRLAESPGPGQPSTLARRVPDEFPMREDPGIAPTVPAPGTPSPAPPSPVFVPVPGILPPPWKTLPTRTPGGDRSTWERLAITPDVEIHVRRPLDRRTNKLVERLARIARELFEDEP